MKTSEILRRYLDSLLRGASHVRPLLYFVHRGRIFSLHPLQGTRAVEERTAVSTACLARVPSPPTPAPPFEDDLTEILRRILYRDRAPSLDITNFLEDVTPSHEDLFSSINSLGFDPSMLSPDDTLYRLTRDLRTSLTQDPSVQNQRATRSSRNTILLSKSSQTAAWHLDKLALHMTPPFLLDEAAGSGEAQRLIPDRKRLSVFYSRQEESAVALSQDAVAYLALSQLDLAEGLAAYKILKFLGVGEVAFTFLAIPVGAIMGMPVTLKIPQRKHEKNTSHFSFFKFFIKAFQENNLSGLLPIDFLMREGDRRFWVTKYLPGGNLEKVIGELSGPRKIGTAIQALRDVTKTLCLAHSKGIFHGAVNRTNIIYDGRSFALTDYYGAALRPAVDLSAVDDTRSLIATIRDLLAPERESLPGWLSDLIDRRPDPDSSDPPTAKEMDRVIDRFVFPEDGQLATLNSAWNAIASKITYNLEVDGVQKLRIFDCDAGLKLIRDLCAIWREAEELAWSDLPEAELSREIGLLLKKAGDTATRMIFGFSLLREFSGSMPRPLWLIYHPDLAAVPWELLEVNHERLCLSVPMARSPRLGAGTPLARAHQVVALGSRLRVLLIADLSEDLPFARQECFRLEREFKASCIGDNLDVRVIAGNWNHLDIFEEMRSSDVIHFAGHAVFSEDDPTESALLLCEGERLLARTLIDFWQGSRAPFLFFANACTSARGPEVARRGFTTDAAMGLAQAFLAAGVASYVGAAWPVPDTPATVEFASAFYRRFFSGYTASQAMLEARKECARCSGAADLTWARYILLRTPLQPHRLDPGVDHELRATDP